jgi:hypothetical protein
VRRGGDIIVPLELSIISIVFGTLGSVGVFSLVLWFKLKKKELEMRGSDPELGPVVDALRDELADMQEHTQAQLAEMQERLDFAERMLTAGRASQDEKSE